MEFKGRERIENEPDLTVTRPKRLARHHERWLVQAGFAVRADDGRLLLTAHGHEVGRALFGFTR
jgi:hypothetical protein